MRNLVETFKNKRANKDETGSAMIFALVLTILAISIVTTVSAVALSNLQKTAFIQTYTNNGLAAETALSNALMAANSPEGNNILRAALSNDPLASNTIKGTVNEVYSSGVGEQKWVWYTTRISQSSSVNKYYVNAIGYTDSPTGQYARHYRAVIESVVDVNAVFDSATNLITYTPNENAVAQWGMLGSSNAKLLGNVKIKSYLSDMTATPTGNGTGFGQVASNGVITVTKGTEIVVNTLGLLNYNTSDPDRCQTTANCANLNKVQITYKTDLTKVASAVETACPANNYPVWVASANGGVLNPGCYNSLIFDTTTTIGSVYNEINPAKVYIKGDITVNAGVKINNDNSPLALQIYSQGGEKATFVKGSSSNPTKFYGYIAGGVLQCTDGTTTDGSIGTPTLQIYGALACDSLNFGGGTELWWDELSSNIAGDTSAVRRLWHVTKYEEVYK